jgi:hypothetical protein
MGEDNEGEKIRDPMRSVGQVLLNPAISNKDKTRIIALYVMFKNGITAENLNKLGSHAQLEDNELNIIKNMANLGVNVVSDVSVKYFFDVRLVRVTFFHRETAADLTRWSVKLVTITRTHCPDGPQSLRT